MLYLWLPFFFDRLRGVRHVVKVRSWLISLCYPFCWSSMSYFVNTAPSLFKSHCLVGQIAWLFILIPTVLLVRKQRFQFNPLPFCWSESKGYPANSYYFVGQKTWLFILNSAVLSVRKSWFSYCPLQSYLWERTDFSVYPYRFICQEEMVLMSSPMVSFVSVCWVSFQTLLPCLWRVGGFHVKTTPHIC